jgi:serine protease Do
MNTKGMLLLLALPLAAITTACLHAEVHRYGTQACGHSGEENRSKATVMFADNKERGYLGISVDDVTPKLARRKNLKVEEGVYVQSVEEGSPAETAGIKEGDVIVEFDGKKISDNNDLISEVRKTKPGTEVSIAVNRDGDKKTVKATIDKSPREYSSSYSFPSPPKAPRIHVAPRISIKRESAMYGLTLEELNRQLGEYFGAPNGRGVLVKNVKRSSDAEKAGFKAGDVIMKVGKDEVTDVDDIWSSLDEYKKGEKAEFEILRKGTKQKLSLAIEQRDDDLGLYRFDFDGDDDDVIIDLLPRERRSEFHRETENLKRNLEKMKEDLHDNMIELKHRIMKRIDRVRVGVNV